MTTTTLAGAVPLHRGVVLRLPHHFHGSWRSPICGSCYRAANALRPARRGRLAFARSARVLDQPWKPWGSSASPLCYTFWTRLIPVVCYCCGSVSVFHWAPLLRRRSSCWWCHQILCQVVIHLLDHSPTRVPPRVWRWMARHGAWMFSSKV